MDWNHWSVKLTMARFAQAVLVLFLNFNIHTGLLTIQSSSRVTRFVPNFIYNFLFGAFGVFPQWFELFYSLEWYFEWTVLFREAIKTESRNNFLLPSLLNHRNLKSTSAKFNKSILSYSVNTKEQIQIIRF